MTDFQGVGQQFVEHYYKTLDSNRDVLSSLYQENSMLSFEGDQFLGTGPIMEKLGGMPALAHQINTQDYQPTVNEGIIAFVTGQLTIDGGNAMNYTQVFHLAVGGSQGYYVYNDIFRLNLV